MESKDDVCWHVLIGAMLASPTIRKQATAAFLRSELPAALKPLWDAMGTGDGNKVRDALEGLQWLPRGGQGKVLDSLIAKLQALTLDAFLQARVRSAENMRGTLGADAVADTLEQWASEIRQRQAQIAKNGDGKDASQ